MGTLLHPDKEHVLQEDASMPLEVMLQTMRRHWREGRVEEAVALAKAAAPYLHAKASNGRGFVGLDALGDEQLDDLCKRGFEGAAPAGGDTE